jgi:hypothetical protein
VPEFSPTTAELAQLRQLLRDDLTLRFVTAPLPDRLGGLDAQRSDTRLEGGSSGCYGETMSEWFDFAAYDTRGELGLAVEVMARRGIDNMWARDVRANIAERLGTELPPLLIATPKALYAWRRGTDLEDLPDYEASSETALGSYYRSVGIDGDDFIEPSVFAGIVARWLDDVMHGESQPLGKIEELLAPVRGGRVVREAA